MTRIDADPPRQSLLGNLALALAVSAACAGVLEGFCRLAESRRPRPPVADYLWDWQRRWDGDFYTMRSEANGWPPWEEFNADGMRDRTHAPEKPVGTRRVVFLGDSVTLGDQIQPAQAYPQFLQADLADAGHAVEVFNVALWGWLTRQERLAYERIARRYAPDDVVLAVCLNDIPELQNNLSRPPRFLTALHERSALVRRLVDAERREIGSVEELFGRPEPEKVRVAFVRAQAARALGRIGVRSLALDRALARAVRDRTPAVAKEAHAAALELGLLVPREPFPVRPMRAVLAAAAAAALLALGATPFVAAWARRRNCLDVPDGRARTHPRAVPRIGGVAVMAAFAGGLVLAAHPAWGVGPRGLALLAAAGAILLIGFADDLRGVPVAAVLAVQGLAALGLVAQSGAARALALPGGLTIGLGVLALPLTVLWLLAVANAFDAIDRVDGLAAGGGAVAAALLAAIALGHERTGAAVVAAALAGALAGFFRYNRRPASIFLGDGGSLACGFVLGAVALWTATDGDGVLRPGVPIAVVVLPLLLAAGRGRRAGVVVPVPVPAERGEL